MKSTNTGDPATLSTQQIKELQHYLPKFLLKKFVDTKSKGFKVFDKKDGKFFDKIKYPKHTMASKFFYEHSSTSLNEVEDLLSARETIYADLINRIVNGLENISEDDYRTLVEFRHVTYYRSSEFFAFHTHSKSRGPGSWVSRADWRSLSFIYKLDGDYKEMIKKSQLDAIRRTIEGEEAILDLSLMTPICFLLQSMTSKFVIGDSGSISMGGEFDGLAVIVVSPHHALMFPKTQMALKIMSELGINSDNWSLTIIRVTIPNDLVDVINSDIKDCAYRYWIESI